ncbi:hypothetical protein A9Q83_07300 [Alphaproteobacteria bacterium 46_93_T64]|nr:hypothetical protein A9Q83_07300 [Alphaproteobacteria bacterium 46_93_T64]
MMSLFSKITSFWTTSLRNRILIGIVVFQSILIILFEYGHTLRQQILLDETSMAQVQGLATELALSSSRWIEFSENQALGAVVNAHSNFPDLKYAMVTSPTGEILAHNDSGAIGTFVADGILKSLMKSPPVLQVLRHTDHVLDVAAPIMLQDRHVGWARVGLSRASIIHNLQAMENDGFFFFFVGITLSAFVTYIVSRGPARSLQNMVDIAEGYRTGQKDLRITEDRPDELGVLAASMNSLADTVNRREAELFHQREHLEEVVLERTRDLVKEVRERQSAEEHITLVLNSAIEGIITADPEGNILNYNPAAEKIFGYKEQEVLGKSVGMLMPAETADRHEGYMLNYLNGAESKIIGIGGREVVAKRKNGEEFLMEIAISELKNKNAHFYTGIVRDITKRKEAERKLHDTLETLQLTQDELVQSEKMASLGGLVAGVAHEINTPIGVGVTAASHLQEKTIVVKHMFDDGTLKKGDFKNFIETATQSTDILSTNLQRASDLIKSFKQVAVDQSSEAPRLFNLLEYLDEVLISLHPKLKQTKIKVIVDGDRDLDIESLPGTFAQILTNLVMNSLIHAYEPNDEGCIHIHAEAKEDNVELTYSDDGRGMKEHTVNKVFDPFFTTKRGTGGSGLGMHILYNQTTQTLGGSVKCSSVMGKGTTFNFTFPLKKENQQ